MYWLLDIAFIALFMIVVYEGFHKGIFGMLFGFLSFFLKLFYTIIIIAVVVFVAEYIGAVDGLTIGFIKLLGESSIYPTNIVANILAVLVFIIFAIALVTFTLFFMIRGARERRIKKGKKPFVISRIIGLVVALALYAGALLAILGFVRAIADCGEMSPVHETIKANPILGMIYKWNPLTAIFEKTKIPQLVVDIFSGNFDKLM